MVLTDLYDLVREHFFTSPLGIDDNRLDGKTGLFQIAPGFLVHRPAFGGYFLPVQVLLQAGGTYDDDAVAPAKEGAVYADYNWACDLGARVYPLATVQVPLDGFLRLIILFG